MNLSSFIVKQKNELYFIFLMIKSIQQCFKHVE